MNSVDHRIPLLFRTLVRGLLPAVAMMLIQAGCALPDAPVRSVGKDQRLLTEAFTRIDNEYVTPVDSRALVYTAIRSMMQTLDPHSVFFTPAEFRALQDTTRGEFGGVGIEVSWRDGELIVDAPLAGTPAARAGIVAGDRILTIDGKPVPVGDINQVVVLLRGKPGTVVTLTLQRRGQAQPIQVSLRREEIYPESVTARFVAPGIGYLQVRLFQGHTDSELRAALDTLGKKGGWPNGLILDLRGNPGGLLDQAVKVADIFLEHGVIVSTKGRDPQSDLKFMAHQKGTEPKCPLVILVNEGTASAAEIVAGALHDQKRAVLVGTRTYGKGSVQKLIELADGSGLKLTTAHYYTPSGVSIQGHGIDPDWAVSQQIVASSPAHSSGQGSGRQNSALRTEGVNSSDARDQQLQKALELLNKGSLTGAKSAAVE